MERKGEANSLMHIVGPASCEFVRGRDLERRRISVHLKVSMSRWKVSRDREQCEGDYV